MKDGFYGHFHPEERSFVDRVVEWMERVSSYHEHRLTDFLDPRQLAIVNNIAAHYDVQLLNHGGYEQAERTRVLIAPEYANLSAASFDIELLEIELVSKQSRELDHADYLGTLLGLGIKRDRIGDIHVHAQEHTAHVFVVAGMASFVLGNLNKVSRYTAVISSLALNKFKPVSQKLEELTLSVASMRLDGIVSDVYRLSRAKVLDPIRAGRCKVNWKVEQNPAKLITQSDVISMQGLGRFKVLAIEGQNKKGRTRVVIGKYI